MCKFEYRHVFSDYFEHLDNSNVRPDPLLFELYRGLTVLCNKSTSSHLILRFTNSLRNLTFLWNCMFYKICIYEIKNIKLSVNIQYSYFLIFPMLFHTGYWLFHCHFLFHIVIGMNLILHVGAQVDLPPVPPNFPTCGDHLPPITPPLPIDTFHWFSKWLNVQEKTNRRDCNF